MYAGEVGELYTISEVHLLLLLLGPALISQAYCVQQIARSPSVSVQAVLGVQVIGMILCLVSRSFQGTCTDCWPIQCPTRVFA